MNLRETSGGEFLIKFNFSYKSVEQFTDFFIFSNLLYFKIFKIYNIGGDVI